MNQQQLLLFDQQIATPFTPGQRQALDLYPTHRDLTLALLERVAISGRVAEPAAGPGDMARVLLAHPGITAVTTNDIDPQWSTDFTGDAGNPGAAVWKRPYDWVVTNPPFSVAPSILRIAYECAGVGVAFLLRLSFAEPAGNRAGNRGDWLAEHADQLRHVLVFGQPRPSFTPGGGTDSVTTAWFVWQKGWSWARLGIAPPFQFVMGWKRP